MSINGEGLLLMFRDDGDGTGNLSAVIESEGFRGRGAAYFDAAELKHFAQALRAFPLPVQPRLRIAGGFYSREQPGVLKDTLLSVEFYPVGSLGQLGVLIHVETEIWPGDRHESKNEASIELLTTYALVDAFSRELERLVMGQDPVATLMAERLA